MIANCELRIAERSDAARAELPRILSDSAIRNQTPIRVLVLTLSFGSGHVSAARAVANEIARQNNAADVRVVDALVDARLLFKAFYVAPYWAMIRYAPRVWERFFKARVESESERTAPEWAFRWGCRKVFEEIESFKPDTIVACEVAACEMASMAKREGLTNARVVAVITDHESEPVWVKKEVDAYAVADEKVRAELASWGAPVERIKVCGIPVDAKFLREGGAEERRAARTSLGIEDGAPLALLMGGGMGPTRMDKVAANLLRSGETLHVVAVAGRDTRALCRLEKLRASETAMKGSCASLHVLGWTNDVARLMRAADVLVTKPGGLTLTEACACAAPMVLFDAIPGPEERNAARFVAAGAGVQTRGSRATADAVLKLLSNGETRERMRANARCLARPAAANVIAQLACDIEKGSF